MKAVVLHEYGGPEKLKWEDFPDPVVGKGDVLIRVSAVSVNPIDYKQRSGAVKERMPLEFPAILGRDLAGIVRAVGEGVTGFEPGDHVFALGNKTYAELCVLPAKDIAKIPEGLDVVKAGALPLVCLTGEQLITRGTGVQPGETVLISGAVGGVGRAAVRTAKDAGAKVIAAVRAKQLQEAETLGADAVVALDDKEAMAKVGYVDAVADIVGGEVAEMLMVKVKPGGVFASVVGQPPANAALNPTVRFVRVTCVPDPEKMVKLAKDVVQERLAIPVDRMIAMEDAGEGQAVAAKGGIGKVILVN